MTQLGKESEKLFNTVMESLEVLMNTEPKVKKELKAAYVSVDTIRDQLSGNI